MLKGLKMSFKEGDNVICSIKKFNIKATKTDYYYIETKKGIITGTVIIETGSKKIMYLVNVGNEDPWGRPFDQLYIYEENIILDKVKIRNDKLKELGL